MNSKQYFLWAYVLIFISSGCATMFNSGSQVILARASNDNEGIKVEVTGPTGSYSTELPATIAA